MMGNGETKGKKKKEKKPNKQNPSSVIYSILPLYNHPAVPNQSNHGETIKKQKKQASKQRVNRLTD